jgi:hypothetical protein
VNSGTDHYLVVVKVRERLAVWKQATQKFHMERFGLKKVNKVGGKEQYQVKISNGLQLWKTLKMMWTAVELGKLFYRVLAMESLRSL